MTPKEFLQQYRDAEYTINAKLEEISRLRSMATKVTQTLSQAPAHGSDCDKTATIVAKIVDMEREVDEDIDRLQGAKKQVLEAIDTITDRNQRKVLYLRYINGNRWEEIAVSLNYTYRNVTMLHGKALQSITFPCFS